MDISIREWNKKNNPFNITDNISIAEMEHLSVSVPSILEKLRGNNHSASE